MDSLPLELYNMRKQETSQREALWTRHINNVIEDHNQTFKEAKALVDSMPQDLDTNDTVKVFIDALYIFVRLKANTFQMFCSGSMLIFSFSTY